MPRIYKHILIALIALLACLLYACGTENVVPTAPPPRAPTLRPTSPAPTSVSVVATSVPQATSAPSARATAMPPNTCPFTGMPLNTVNLATRRPLLVKLGNSPPERPQSGLAQADVVVEHLTEGAITRFSAIFYCTDAPDIGPIRSARLIDLELVPMFGAIFAHVGGSEPIRAMIAASEIAQADFDDYGRAPIFREITTRKRPFNRYTSTSEMYARALNENLITGTPAAAFPFDANPPAGGRAASNVTIPYRKTLSDAVFDYDPMTRLFERSTGTTPHLDAISNQPLTAANVLVLYAPHETTDIIEDSLGSRSVRITLTGTGRATLVRDGQAYDVTWTRSAPSAPLRLTNANGIPIPFKPGNIWVQVVPPEMQVTVQ